MAHTFSFQHGFCQLIFTIGHRSCSMPHWLCTRRSSFCLNTWPLGCQLGNVGEVGLSLLRRLAARSCCWERLSQALQGPLLVSPPIQPQAFLPRPIVLRWTPSWIS